MRFLIVAGLALVAGTAQAEFVYDGNAMFAFCGNSKPEVTGYVSGWLDKFANDRAAVQLDFIYLKGKTDVRYDRLAAEVESNICLPNGVTKEQATDVVCKFLQDNPKNRQLTSMYQMTHALAGAFPCK